MVAPPHQSHAKPSIWYVQRQPNKCALCEQKKRSGGAPEQDQRNGDVDERVTRCHVWAGVDGLTRLIPIRDTALRDRVARALRFQNTADYEAAARVQIRADAALAADLRALVGPMPA